MKTHYETLGVNKTATKEEIKAAYRKLCMETHPDVATAGSKNVERFRQVSEAHAVLSDSGARIRYDYEMNEALRFGKRMPKDGRSGADIFGSSRGRRSGTSSVAMHILDGVYKPRNLFVGVTLGFATVALVKSSFFAEDDNDGARKKRTGKKNMVEAWQNPSTGKWEQPAPWDSTYKQLKPKLHLVPREVVHERRR